MVKKKTPPSPAEAFKKEAAEKKLAAQARAQASQKKRKAARSAVTGLFVTPEYAKKHPKTTEVETIKPKRPRPKKKP
jgi:hypothetical protein